MTKPDAKQLKAEPRQFTGTEQYYFNPLFEQFRYTDGVKFLAERAGAYWLLDYLLDGFGIEKDFTETLAASLSSSYTSLDPSLPKEGKYISKWKVLANTDEATVFSSIET